MTVQAKQQDSEFYDLTEDDINTIDDMADFYSISREKAYEIFISGGSDSTDFL